MAKDGTGHARIREPKQESQADIVARGAMQALCDVSYAAAVGIGDFCHAVADCLMDFARRMEETRNEER